MAKLATSSIRVKRLSPLPSPSALSLQHVHEELDLAELAALLALDGGLLVKQRADGHEVTVAGVALLVPARGKRNE